jgi:hypothetical protein
MSGHAQDQERLEKEVLLGGDCVFRQKPFTTETLGRTIRTLLEGGSPTSGSQQT